jgi:hypothetical protein
MRKLADHPHDGNRKLRKIQRRRGAGLIELVVTTLLASLLGILMALACATFARPALEVEARTRIAQEATLITQSLACDLGGYWTCNFSGTDPYGNLTSNQMSPGSSRDYQWTGCDYTTDPTKLQLTYQVPSTGTPVTVTYQFDASSQTLTRADSSTQVNGTTTISSYVTSFETVALSGSSTQFQINFTVTFRNFSASYSLIGQNPS